MPHQNALTLPGAEDHYGANVYHQMDRSDDIRKQRLGRLRNGVGSVQRDVGQVMPMRLWMLGPSQPGYRQAIPLGNQSRLGCRIKCQLHRLGHAANLVGEPFDDTPQLVGVRRLELGRVRGQSSKPSRHLWDDGWRKYRSEEHQQDVRWIKV